MGAVLACVVNISEGRDLGVVDAIAAAAGDHLLDAHHDPWHHRSVLTLAGPEVEDATRAVAVAAVDRLDIRAHEGVHPRLGVLDVVPFVPLANARLEEAVGARDRFARWLGAELGVPAFFYAPERSLPDVRRRAFVDLAPDAGPDVAHPTAGASCVGARGALVAYNLWLAGADLATARAIAAAIRSSSVRALAFPVGDHVQVSCNLVDPERHTPDAVFDAVAARAPVARAELVGLLPRAVLERVPVPRWAALDLDPSKTIEARLEQAGLDGGSGG